MRYERLSFGTKNALAIFQRVMDEVLHAGGCDEFACAYVDDILISSESMQEHVEHVSKVLDCLHAVGLRIHPEKSIFGAQQLEFLVHMISPGGMQPLRAKVAAIQALPTPANLPQLRSIIGIMSYYRCYIPNFSVIARPLYDLTKQNAPWLWTSECEHAYNTLKDALCTPGLALQAPDANRQYVLHTDWSQLGLGCVLGQIDDNGQEYMVACQSRSLNEHEKRYTPWKGLSQAPRLLPT
jgi:hypothetical protein